MRRANATIFGPLVALACAASFLSACGGGNEIESFCAAMLDLDENDPTEGLEEGSPEFFEATVGAFDDIASKAPDDIRDDVETMGAAMEQLSTLADDPEGNAEEALALLEEAGPAGQRVDTYVETNCES